MPLNGTEQNQDEPGVVRRALNWTPILMLHEVLPDSTSSLPPYAMTQSGFRSVLRDFASRGYKSGTLDDVLAGKGRRGKRVVLTFDDGTADFIEYALPVLEEFKFTATLFIVAGLIGKSRLWLARPGQEALREVPLMPAPDLRDLHARGFTIASHSMMHPSLPSLSPEEAAKEAVHSRELLSDMVGGPVMWFAYPYNAATAQSREAVRAAGYEGACGGTHQAHSRYYMNRIDPSMYTLPELRLRTNGLFHTGRELVRQVRYRG